MSIKRILSAILALVLLLGCIPVTAQAAQPTSSEDGGAVSRAQWLRQLTQTFEMSVDEGGNYPDNYFSDLSSDSEYYYDVLLAVEFGVVDIPAGGAVRPEDPATREFAAQTLNYCLGFQFEGTSYTFSDASQCTYPADAQIAVDRGWLALVDGAFCPEASITATEMETMLADAAEIYASQTIDPEFASSYIFADHVVEFPYGTDVEIDENGTVTIYNADEMLTSGTTFVVYPTKLPALYQAVSVSGDTNVMTITTTEADEASAIVSINSEGMADMDISQFEAEEGVSAMYIQNEADIALAMDTYGISVSKGSVVAEKEVSLSNGIKAKVVFNISNIKLNSRINTVQGSYYVTVSGDTTLTGSVSVDAIKEAMGQSSVTLGTARVAGIGKVTISVELALNGKITLTYTGGFEAGVQKDSSGFRLVKTFYKKTFSTVVEANASIGLKADFAIDIIAAKANIYVVTGVAGKFVSNTYGDGKMPKNCTNINAWLFANIGASATVGIKPLQKTWSKNIVIFDAGNSPARVSFHYEDWVQVGACTRGSQTGYNYTTAADSPYGTSSYGGGSSTGTGSNGEVYTIYTYDLDNENNATITGYKGNASALAIPETIDGYPVTAIGSNAFKGNKSIYVVTIPEGVTAIHSSAFSNCIRLQTVLLPDSLITIGAYAFSNTALTSLQLPNSVERLEAQILSGNTGITEIWIPKSVTVMDSFTTTSSFSALRGSNVHKVIFEEGITKIPARAASGLSYLTEVVIPDTVTEIATSAFSNCPNLKQVQLPDTITVIGSFAFSNTGLTSLTLPKYVERLDAQILSGNKGITEIKIPRTVTVMDSFTTTSSYGALHGSSIQKVTFEEGITRIPARAVSGMNELTEVVLPDTITEIATAAFANCPKLQSLQLPDTITAIATSAFANNGLTSLTLPKYVERLEAYILSGTKGVTELTIPKTVSVMDAFTTTSSYGALHGSYVQKVIFEEGLTKIPARALSGASYLTEVVIPKTVTSIAAKAFAQTALKNFVIPDTVTEWGSELFLKCKELESVTLPEKVKNIGANMFEECTALTRVELPKAAECIDHHAFKNCTSLKEIVWSSLIQTIDYNAFEGCSALTDVEIPESVAILGHSVFYNCDSLTRVVIPDSVTTVGTKVFYDCDALTDVTLGNGMTTIPTSTFEHCDLLASIELPRSIQSIGASAFKNCVKFTTITIPPETTSVGSNAFSYPAKMTIRGEAGSYAQTYAEGKYITFEAMEFPKPEEPDPTEPTPTEPTPTEPTPTEPTPTEPKPTEPTPTEPTPTEPKPTEPKPTEPTPTEPKPTEPKPTDPKPAEPKAPEIKASGISSTGKTKISWNKVEGAAKYEVYRATSKTGKYSRMKTTTGTSYTNTSAKAGTRYYYYVLSVAEDGTQSEKSSIVSRTCDLARPSITLTGISSSGSIKVSWKKIDGAKEYKVYRATSKNGTYKLMKTTSSTSYTNSSVKAGTTYYYKVKAVHENSAANSAYSSYKYRTCDLPRPDVEITLKKGDPRLTWDKIDGAKKYEIYRATSKNGTYKLMKTTTSTSYTNTTAKAGKTYYYKVKAIHSKSAANSAYSSIVSIKAK